METLLTCLEPVGQRNGLMGMPADLVKTASPLLTLGENI